MKKTPSDHPDYEPVKAALDLMKEVCSNVNETKRQLEQLEKLEDLQATIANWEVSLKEWCIAIFTAELLALRLPLYFPALPTPCVHHIHCNLIRVLQCPTIMRNKM